jgi:hypothetical protein
VQAAAKAALFCLSWLFSLAVAAGLGYVAVTPGAVPAGALVPQHVAQAVAAWATNYNGVLADYVRMAVFWTRHPVRGGGDEPFAAEGLAARVLVVLACYFSGYMTVSFLANSPQLSSAGS